MSQFMPEPETEDKRRESKAGPEAYLSSDERKALQRSLSLPEDLPPRFKSWLIDFIAVNIPQIPVSQIIGFKQIDQVEVSTNEVATGESTTSGTYTDLSTVGPQLTTLRDGRYVVFFGASSWNNGSQVSYMSPSINGATALDVNAAMSSVTTAISVTRALSVDLTSGTNTLVCKYRTDFATLGSYQARWLIAQRIGPVS